FLIRLPPPSPLSPYTTLFRSGWYFPRCRNSSGISSSRPSLGPAFTIGNSARLIAGLPSASSLGLCPAPSNASRPRPRPRRLIGRSEEHTSELQSRENLVCRLL